MDRNHTILERLTEYAETDMYPFHMPGHKRQIEAKNLSKFPNPFEIDITEIDGFDNLHHPQGMLKESMEWAASVYGADRTWYLVNGSSCGILSAVCALVKAGGRILMSRNCHKAAYHGVILNRLKTEYIYPQTIGKLGIQGGISLGDVEKKLQEYPDIQAVLVVSPTYDGVVSDIEGIAAIAHKKGIPLIVDEAHGAHFPFNKNGPKSALDCGADLVIQSVHKTLPSLTQTAVLHARKGYVDLERVERYLQIFQSSSPSYVFMASIESCILEMEQSGADYFDSFEKRICKLRQALSGMKHFHLLDCSIRGNYEVFDVDESKLVVSVKGCYWKDQNGKRIPIDGVWMENELRRNYHLEMEMAGADYVVAILTYLDTQQGLDRLEKALLELDGLVESFDDEEAGFDLPFPEAVMTLAEAADSVWEKQKLEDCAGKVSAEFIYLYPPGIPLVAPGEIITQDMVFQVLQYKKMNLPVQGMADPDASNLRIIKWQA